MKFQRHDNVWGVGPLNKSVRNMQLFCEALIYSSACTYTVQAYQTMDKLPETDATNDDMSFYLETLFSQPLEENV